MISPISLLPLLWCLVLALPRTNNQEGMLVSVADDSEAIGDFLQAIDFYVDFFTGFFIGKSHRPKYPNFKQCDSRWKDDRIQNKTIWEAGSLISSVSMALHKNDNKIDGLNAYPKTLNNWLDNNEGYRNGSFVWKSVEKLGLWFIAEISDTNLINDYLSVPEYEIILNMHKGDHWALVTGSCRKGWTINDPRYSFKWYKYMQVSKAAIFKKWSI